MKKTELEPHFIAIARHQYVEYLQIADVYMEPHEMQQGASDIVLTVLHVKQTHALKKNPAALCNVM